MATPLVDICIIEDDAHEQALLVRRFTRHGYNVVAANDGEAGLDVIRKQRPRVVISDVMMPRLGGIELCRRVRSDTTLDGTYLILVTAYDSLKRKRDALNAGADDYLIKPYDAAELEAKARNGIRLSQLQERLRRAALTDGLTGLWNHARFRELLDKEFSRTRRYGGDVALLMIDLDHFKAVNDTYGHETGNRVLRATAEHLQRSVRDIDHLSRYGGEEFAVICPQTNLEAAVVTAERIRASLAEAVRVADHPELVVRASIGVAASSDQRIHAAQDLVSYADQALYLAKARGRDQVRRCDEVGETSPGPAVQLGEVDRLRKQVMTLSMQAKELCLQSVWALIQALEARDPFTAQHSRNVRFYTQRLVERAGWPENLRKATANAAMLHDLGKIGVPDRILQKPATLTPDEAAVLRQVPLISCKILEPLKVFDTETQMIRHLRERFDGSGYPDGLKDRSIPIGSRMLAVAEAFDALTTDRAYRSHRPLSEAVAEIEAQAGTQFDPEFTALLADTVAQEQQRWQERVERTRAALELLTQTEPVG